MALAQTKITATQDRLNALCLSQSGWSASARADAHGRVIALGLPVRRDEYWKYTRPDELTSPNVINAEVSAEDNTSIFGSLDCLSIVFEDGIFNAEKSDKLEDAEITLELLSEVNDLDIHWATGLYGVLETKGQAPVDRPLAALNTAFAREGLLMHVKGTVTKPISLIYLQNSDNDDVMLHHIIKMDKGASATILESGPVGARCNIVMEAEIEDGASLNHVRAQGRNHERRAATHLFARLNKKSQLKSFTLTMNGALTRNEAFIEICGDDSVAHIAGASVGDGAFHHDDTVFIIHDALRGESRQVFKKVLRNGATGVFQGKILVKPDAQKTDGYQISQSLLLDDDSQFLAKPELEIYADDVVCSHGSTSGAIDEEAIFYLNSRGIPKVEATNLLTLAFLAEALSEVEDEDIAEVMERRLEDWLTRRL
jgi:Fe-S cluster assembly protein SufD